jgi:hypothetical protein
MLTIRFATRYGYDFESNKYKEIRHLRRYVKEAWFEEKKMSGMARLRSRKPVRKSCMIKEEF